MFHLKVIKVCKTNLICFYLQMHMISHSSVCEDAAQRKCMNEYFCLMQNMQRRGA